MTRCGAGPAERRGGMGVLRVGEWLLVVALLVVAAALRLHRFDQIPWPGETSDELAYLWSGWSWLHHGAPTAWSDKPQYLHPLLAFYGGQRYRLVTPWLDHPPLFSLLLGMTTILTGAPEMFDASLTAARVVSVALGAISVALLYLVARRAYGRVVAVLAMLLFATIPTVVVASRLALAETLIVPLVLGGILAVERYLEQAPGGRRWLVAAAFAAGAASAAKVPGVTVAITLGLILLASQRRAAAGVVGLGALAGLVPYVGYGLLTAPPLLAGVLFSQSSRATGLDVLPNLLLGIVVPPVDWPDAWMPFLWLALAYAVFRRDRLLTFAVGPYLVFLVAAVPEDGLRIWYREPLFPFLCLAGGIFLRDAIARPNLLAATLVLFGTTFGKISDTIDAWDQLGPTAQAAYPAAVAILAAPFAALAAWPGRLTTRVASGAVVAGLVVAVGASVFGMLREDELYPPPKPHLTQIDGQSLPNGLVLASFHVEPDLLAPGGAIRVATTWIAKRDVSDATLTVDYRPFAARTHTYGDPSTLGDPMTFSAAAGAQQSEVVTGQVPANLPVGDYDLGLTVDSNRVDLGLVRVRASGGEALEEQAIGLPATFGGEIALDQALLVRPRPTAEGPAYALNLKLRPLHALDIAYHVFVHLESADGRVVAQSDGLPGQLVDPLPVGKTIVDQHVLVVPPSTPPGRYYLTVGLYEHESGRRLPLADGADHLAVGEIEVGPPLAETDIANRLGARLAGGVELVGYDVGSANPASGLKLTLYWRSDEPLDRDYTVFAQLIDRDGRLRAQADGQPDGGRVPTSTWRPGQIIPDPHVIPLAGVPAGSYRVLAGLYRAPDGPRLPVVGRSDGAVPVATTTIAP